MWPPVTTSRCDVSTRRAWAFALAEIGCLAGLTTFKAWLLLSGSLLGTPRGFLVTFGIVFGFGALLLAAFPRRRRILYLIATVTLSVVLFADQVHHRAYRELVTVRELNHAGQLADVFDGVTPYLHWLDLGFFVDWPAWLWLWWRRKAAGPEEAGRLRFIVPAMAAGGSLSVCVFLSWDFLVSIRPDARLVVNQRYVIRELGVLGFHLCDGIDRGRSRSTVRAVGAEQLQHVQHWFEARREEKVGPDQVPFGAAHGANLIFLQLESFEAFLLGLVVNGHEITPRLNRLRNEAWSFSRFFPQTGVGTTSDAEFCALNSLPPAVDEPVAWRNAGNTFRALPAILAREGYHTMALSVCRPDLWNMGRMHRQYGFARRYYYETFANGRENPLAIADDRFLRRARELIRASPRPFFAHLMTISTHSPFRYLPPDWPRLDLGPWQKGFLGDYLQAAHFVDHALGEFLDGLRADAVLDRTVVFIYGDHEALPPDERWKIRRLESDAIGSQLDEQLRRRVPLLVLVPGQREGVTSDRPSAQFDLTPSALHLLGIEPRPAFHLGRNLFRGTNSLVVFRNGSFIADSIYGNRPDGLLGGAGCNPIQPGARVDPVACTNGWRQALELLSVADLIREHDLIPALESAVGRKE